MSRSCDTIFASGCNQLRDSRIERHSRPGATAHSSFPRKARPRPSDKALTIDRERVCLRRANPSLDATRRPRPLTDPRTSDMRHRLAPLAWLFAASATVVILGGCAHRALAQGDLEKTPWATTMVYPVGDPQDFEKPAPGDRNGFSLS